MKDLGEVEDDPGRLWASRPSMAGPAYAEGVEVAEGPTDGLTWHLYLGPGWSAPPVSVKRNAARLKQSGERFSKQLNRGGHSSGEMS